MGTSEVLPGCIGSGGAVTSCVSLYSSPDCFLWVALVWKLSVSFSVKPGFGNSPSPFQDLHSAPRAINISIAERSRPG
jgi:hypothetical protein